MSAEHTTINHCILSIDIGIKNLGYAIISYTKNITLHRLSLEDITLEFDTFNITQQLKRSDNVVIGRCKAMHNFFISIADKYAIDTVIIERQVARNTMAMELMYCISSIAMFYTNDVVIFDPKNKFNKLNLPYSTVNKEHKKQSINYAHEIIKSKFELKLPSFTSHAKRDDISDAINQCFVHLIESGMLKITKEEFVKIITGTRTREVCAEECTEV